MPRIPATLFSGATITPSHSLPTSSSDVLNACVIIPTEFCSGADNSNSNAASNKTSPIRASNTLRHRRGVHTLYQRLLIAILFGFLALEAATAQERDAAFSSISSKTRINGIDLSVKALKLKGVLISSSSRTALVNGRPVQEGDYIGGAEVLEIEQRGIRVLVGSRELTINVGSSIAVDATATRVARNSGAAARQNRKQQLVAERSATPRLQDESSDAASPQHAVRAGETLSLIALRYRQSGVSLDQMMIALYAANPHAFSENINVLHEGATLRIPAKSESGELTPETATAEVVRQTHLWRSGEKQAPLPDPPDASIMASVDMLVGQGVFPCGQRELGHWSTGKKKARCSGGP